MRALPFGTSSIFFLEQQYNIAGTHWAAYVLADSCNLEMQLYTEEVESEIWAALPPGGALRNLALKLANTEVQTPGPHPSLKLGTHTCHSPIDP